VGGQEEGWEESSDCLGPPCPDSVARSPDRQASKASPGQGQYARVLRMQVKEGL
jgi:hypothetical protein